MSIGDKKYMFDENYLLILKETDDLTNIYFLKLFSPYVECTKLVKYHFS